MLRLCSSVCVTSRNDNQTAELYQNVMSANKLRMYLNEYHPQINESAMSRVHDKWEINMWILFYLPTTDVIRYRIPEI